VVPTFTKPRPGGIVLVTMMRADEELLRLWGHPVNTPGTAEGMLMYVT